MARGYQPLFVGRRFTFPTYEIYRLQSWAFSWIFLMNYKLISKATLLSDANTPSPRANPGAPLGPCLAMRQAGREAQGDGFYSRSPNLRFRMRGGCASGIRLPPSPDALPCLPPGDACLVRRMVPASWLVFISSNRRTQGFALARHCELPVSALPILYADHESGTVFKKVILRVAQDDSY